MDGWWNEEDTFYPFEEAPEEEGFPAEEEPQNLFTPISVADRFNQFEQRPHPAHKTYTPPKPGHLYGQAFSHMPPLTPAKSFSDIQQGDLYGYAAPDDQPITPAAPLTPPPVVYPPMSNPFGQGVGASPLGAATPDTLPDFTARSTPVRRSDHSQPKPSAAVPIWSIDDDPVSFPSASAGDSTSPYPGFPPLPQTNPVSWQQPGTAAFPPVPAAQMPKEELDWTLPEYPAADPNWKPAEGEITNIPEFLKPTEEPPATGDSGDSKSAMDKLNIPAYLRVRPLPKKAHRPSEETAQAPEEAEEQAASVAAPVSGDNSAQPAQEPATPTAASEPVGTADNPAADGGWYTDAIFMRPEAVQPAEDSGLNAPAVQQEQTSESDNDTAGDESISAPDSQPDVSSPEAQPADPSPASSDDASSAGATAPAETETIPEAESPSPAPAEPTPAEDTPVVLSPSPRRRRRAVTPQEEPVPTAEMQEAFYAVAAQEANDSVMEAAPAVMAASTDTAAPARKRRSQRSMPVQQVIPANTASPVEEDCPFGLTVGAEEVATDHSAVRPDQDEPNPVSQPENTFFLPISDEDDPPMPSSPFGGPAGAVSFGPGSADIDGEDDWKPFHPTTKPSVSLFPDTPSAIPNPAGAPYGEAFPNPPGMEEDDWSLFGAPGLTGGTQPDAPPTVPTQTGAPYGDPLPPLPGAEEDDWSLFGAPGLTGGTLPDAPSAVPKQAGAPYGDPLPPLPGMEDDNWSLFGAPGPTGGTLPDLPSAPNGFPPEPNDSTASSADTKEDGLPLFPEDSHLMQGNISNMTDNPLFGTSSYDAGNMPNPDRGNLPYELVSVFDTGSRHAAPAAGTEAPPARQADEVPLCPPSEAGYMSGMFPPMQQEASEPLLTKSKLPPKPAKPPINPVRVLLLVLAVGMAVFCIIAGGKMLLGYVQNTEDWSKTHTDFLNQHGMSMNQAGELVQLPQDGSTFAPTNAPVSASTPVPANITAQHDSAPTNGDAALPTLTPVRRTKAMQYPGNELRNILPAMTEIRKEYPEVIGKLVIPGVLEEWIVYHNNTYYLNHNYRGTSAEGGAVFMDTACTLETPPENLHLRGSGSVPGKTFHALWQYKTGGMAFINNAEMAQVTTLYEETVYLLLAVIETSSDPSQPDYFNYTSYPTFATDEEMLNFVALARQHSIYNLPTDIQPGDRLLTLSTVTGSASEQSTNLVLIFRSMR